MIRKFLPVLLICASLLSCSEKKASNDKMPDLKTVTDRTDLQIAELTGALEKDANNPQLYRQRAELYLKKKDYKPALQDINKAIALNSRSGELHYLKAKILRESGNVPEALKVALQAEQLGYNKPELFVLTGEMYYIIKQYQKAIEYQNKALRVSSFNEHAYFYKGLVYAETGDTLRAISNLQTSIEQEPSFVEPYIELVRIYNAKNEFATANQYIQSGLRFDPGNSFLWYNHGDMLVSQNLPDSAAASFRMAVRHDSTLYLANYNLGVIAYNQDKYPEAIRYFSKVTRYDDKLPQVRLLLADSYERTGDKRKALAQYQLALQKQPGNEIARQRNARLQREVERLQADTAAARNQ